jgi:hypothetical protein
LCRHGGGLIAGGRTHQLPPTLIIKGVSLICESILILRLTGERWKRAMLFFCQLNKFLFLNVFSCPVKRRIIRSTW